jgi:hypothetical protein
MGAGALQQWALTLTSPVTGQPYSISGATWEYAVRTSPSASGPPLIEITTNPTADGAITVTSSATLSQAVLNIYPAATTVLSGTYYHALWLNPGTESALPLFTGSLIISAVPQP